MGDLPGDRPAGGRSAGRARGARGRPGRRRGDHRQQPRPNGPIAAYATYGLGGRFVPMYEAELPQIWQYIVTDSAVKVLFVSKPEILEKVKDFPRTIPTLKKMILIEGKGAGSMAALEAAGPGAAGPIDPSRRPTRSPASSTPRGPPANPRGSSSPTATARAIPWRG